MDSARLDVRNFSTEWSWKFSAGTEVASQQAFVPSSPNGSANEAFPPNYNVGSDSDEGSPHDDEVPF